MFSRQNFLAQKSLNVQLQRIGVLTPTECISMFAEEYRKFRACMELLILLVLSSLLSRNLPMKLCIWFHS